MALIGPKLIEKAQRKEISVFSWLCLVPTKWKEPSYREV